MYDGATDSLRIAVYHCALGPWKIGSRRPAADGLVLMPFL